jgi:hypothetical protein
VKTFLQILSALLLFLVTACSSSYVVSSSNGDTSVDEFNEFTAGKEAEITLIDQSVITATNINLSADSLHWFNPETKLKTGVAKSEIREVQFTDWGLGGLEGAGFGFLSGGTVGVLLIAGAAAVGSELDDSAYSKSFVGIGVVGALIGFTIGAIIGHTNEYEFENTEK